MDHRFSQKKNKILLKDTFNLFCQQPLLSSLSFSDTVNGLSFHPYLPLAASSSGHRRFAMTDDDEIEDSFNLSGKNLFCLLLFAFC